MIAGVVLFVMALAFRGSATNRHVRGRLLVSAIALGAYLLLVAAARYGALSTELQQQIRGIAPLLLAFGIINALVALAINPWRLDRLPDRFPNIVQDSIVIVLFALAATVILQERIFATTAVGAVVVGFALQDTLGNLFAGLAIQIEKPFRVGQWVRIGGADGVVSEITWRATKMRTKAGNFVVVPNSVLSRDTIVNYSEPTPDTRIEIEVGASYDTPPNEVKAVILAALNGDPALPAAREPEVLLIDFAASAMTYRVRVWTTDFSADERIRDRMRSAVYYGFRRAGIVIPYPTQVEIQQESRSTADERSSAAEVALRSVSIFAGLDDEERTHLAAAARCATYAEGELIVRQDAPGSSMFIVLSGEVVVSIAPAGTEVARIGPGGFFGEMSLLTGASRSATVSAAVDSDVLELTVEGFRQFVLSNPAVLEQITLAAALRASELDERRSRDASAPAGEPPATLVARVRRFLRLSVASHS